MNIVFCADRRVLPGVHVAAHSLLERIGPTVTRTRFFIFSDELDESDLALLDKTLASIHKPFTLELRCVDAKLFSGFRSLNGSWAPYYRLFAARIMDVDRFLYVDADTLCDVDVSELQSLDMARTPNAWVPEASLSRAVDRNVAEQLGNSESDFYFNSGVMLVNVLEWRRQMITERAMEYLTRHHPDFWDQSALNVVLHRNAVPLDERFNCIANMRKHWPKLRHRAGQTGQLVHFLDYPKPWNFLGEFVHPQYKLWRSVLDKTAMKNVRSWHGSQTCNFPKTRKDWAGYKKSLKDRLLFTGYSQGWLNRVKGVPSKASVTADNPILI